MASGSSVAEAARLREGFASSVTIVLTNKTGELLEAGREWVKGGEAVTNTVTLTALSNIC